MKEPWFHIDLSWFSAGITGQSIILLLGGLFLIYKSTNEIREKVDEKGHEEKEMKEAAQALGANGVVGVDLDYETLGSANGMLMVTAAGTAVIIE